jgi:hypothetical protein
MHVSTGWVHAVPDLPSAWDAQAFKAVIRNDPRHALISAVPGWQVERQGISSFKGASLCLDRCVVSPRGIMPHIARFERRAIARRRRVTATLSNAAADLRRANPALQRFVL